MFRDRRSIRRWAAHVLLVWLFGVGMGVAHACVLSMAEPGDHHHSTHAVSAGEHVHEVGLADDHDDDQNANCLDFCEKSSISAPKTTVSVDQSANLVSVVIGPGPVAWVVPDPVGAYAPPEAIPEIRWGPPLRIAYQRLAL